MCKEIKIEKNKLYKLYIEDKKSSPEIAKIFNIHPSSIRNKLKKYNIPRRKGGFNKNHIPWSKGVPCSKETKLKISKSSKELYKNGYKHPMLGKHHTKESRTKISIAGIGNKNMLGKHHTKKTKNKLSKLLRKRYKDNPEQFENGIKVLKERAKKRKGKTFEEIYGTEKAREIKEKLSKHKKGKTHEEIFGKEQSKRMIENYKKKRLLWKMPLKDSLPERLVQEALTNAGITFEKHKPLLNICQCDMFIEQNIVIFVDGCYWHGCEQCSNKNKMSEWIKSRKIADILITQKLINNGYIVLRFWEHDIKKDIDYIIYKIQKEISTREVVIER